jgi:hypothetical protein
VGQTVAVVTEYGDATAASDMAAYRSELDPVVAPAACSERPLSGSPPWS